MSGRAARLSRLEGQNPAPRTGERPPIERGCLVELRAHLALPDVQRRMVSAHGPAWLAGLLAFVEARP